MEDLKNRIFRTIEKEIELQDFEAWLYEQNELAERMDEELILELFSFNYGQKGACYEFERKFLGYFEKEDFTNWKIIANLEMLRKGSNESERILWNFNDLSEEGYSFLKPLGYSVYDLEESEYLGWSKKKILEVIREESAQLLEELYDWMEEPKNGNLKEFKSNYNKSYITLPTKLGLSVPKIATQNKWWEFWK